MMISFILLIILVLVGSIALAGYTRMALTKRTDENFENDTNRISIQIVSDFENYNALLYSGRGLITSSDHVNQAEWSNFFKTQSALDRYRGVSSIFYVEIVPKVDKSVFESRLRNDPFFGPDFSIKSANNPTSNYAIASLVYSNNDVRSSLGFDNFNGTERRDAYKLAEKQNKPIASQPIVFAAGSPGFFIALPVYKTVKNTAGFVVVSFRANDLIKTITKNDFDLISLSISDVTDKDHPIRLYNTEGNGSGDLTKSQSVNIAGRTWEITYSSKRSYDYPLLYRSIPRLILVLGLLVIICLALLHRLFRQV